MRSPTLEQPKVLSNYGLGVPPDHDTPCPVCRKNKAQIFFDAHHLIRTNCVFPCESCEKKQKIEVKERRWYEKNAKGVFKHETTGEEVVLDQRGKTMENPYQNRSFDPHGWLQTQKKPFKKQLESEGKL